MRRVISVLVAGVLACGLFAREAPPKLQIDVDFFDNLETVRPYCGSNWIDRFFADCKAHGVKRVTWRCFAQIANYPTKLNYTMDSVQTIRSAADERRFGGAFAAKVGVGRLPPGKSFGGIRQRVVPKDGGRAGARPFREYLFRGMVSSDARPSGAFLAAIDAASGAVLAKCAEVRSFDMRRTEIRFTADKPFDVGVFSAGSDGIHVFVADALSLRALDAPDEELLANGGMEEIDAFMEPTGWTQDGTCFVTLNGDVMSVPEKERKARFPNIQGFNILNHPYRERTERIVRAAEDGNSLALAGKAAKKYGIELYAWYDPFYDGRGGIGSAVELVSGEDAWDGLYMSPTNAQATILFNQPVELSEVLLYSGHLSWVNKCPVEDCTIEGLRGGAWHSLGALTNANVLKGNNQEVPNVCRFAQQTLEGLRVTVTRGGHPTCLVLRAIQGR